MRERNTVIHSIQSFSSAGQQKKDIVTILYNIDNPNIDQTMSDDQSCTRRPDELDEAFNDDKELNLQRDPFLFTTQE